MILNYISQLKHVICYEILTVSLAEELVEDWLEEATDVFLELDVVAVLLLTDDACSIWLFLMGLHLTDCCDCVDLLYKEHYLVLGDLWVKNEVVLPMHAIQQTATLLEEILFP